MTAWRTVSSQDLPFRFGECVLAVRGPIAAVGGNQLPASRTQTVVMDRRTVTEGDGGEQGAVPEYVSLYRPASGLPRQAVACPGYEKVLSVESTCGGQKCRGVRTTSYAGVNERTYPGGRS
ncbi:MAG TPA: hypothetical protein VFA63_12835 [Pseudonocardiaceae bacterium]|nr:hypothetical protein [Pseudonocardiaceae bacterium]